MSVQPQPPPDDSDAPILSLIQRIKAGQVMPSSLSAEQRRGCVEVLRAEGFTLPEIAQSLKRNEKTIRRDIEQIRDELALSPDPNQIARLVGDLIHHSEISIARLRRIGRETSATALERATAEGMAWKVIRDRTQVLQSLGYLPRSPVGIVASIHTEAPSEMQEVNDGLLEELEFLDRVADESGIADLPEGQRCRALLDVVRRRRGSNDVKNIQAKVEKQEMHNHESSRIPRPVILKPTLRLKGLEAWVPTIRRDMGARSLRAFAKAYLPKHVAKPDSRLHQELYPLLQDMPAGGRIAIAAPRGSAKSTLISLVYVLWCICYLRQRYIVLLSDTGEKAELFLGFVRDELLNNERLRADFPELWANPKAQRWRQNEIICGNGVKVSALGFGQNIRGRRHRESRPDLMILDDVESIDNTATPEARQKLSDWFDKSILKAGTQDTRVIVVGTIAHYDALLGRLTDRQRSPTWDGRIYRSIINWSAHPELWSQWTDVLHGRAEHGDAFGISAAQAYFDENRDVMLEGTEVFWPALEDYYKLMMMRETEGLASFDSEKQNHPINPADCLFLEEEFQFWDDHYPTVEALIAATDGHYLIIGSCDPSLGRQGRHADDSAIITVLWDQKNNHIYILDADIQRRRPDEIIDAILNYQRLRNYGYFGFEANCFQSFMADEVARRSNEAGLFLPVQPIKNTTDKLGRIQSLQPLIRDGTIRFSRRHTQLLEQLRHFPKASHDDGPDALEMAVGLIRAIANAPPPSQTEIIPLTPACDQMFSGRGFYDLYDDEAFWFGGGGYFGY